MDKKEQTPLLVRSKNFVERKLGEETVLVPINQTGVDVQSIYTLNATAALVWKLLEDERSEDDIIKVIEEGYTAEDGVIELDVQNILAEFIQERFVILVKE